MIGGLLIVTLFALCGGVAGYRNVQKREYNEYERRMEQMWWVS